MKKLDIKQKQLLAEFLSNLAVALITVGGISPLLDPKYSLKLIIIQFTISIISGIMLLITSFIVIKK